MMLPTHVLEEFVKYFKREEDKQVEALSRWCVPKALAKLSDWLFAPTSGHA